MLYVFDCSFPEKLKKHGLLRKNIRFSYNIRHTILSAGRKECINFCNGIEVCVIASKYTNHNDEIINDFVKWLKVYYSS